MNEGAQTQDPWQDQEYMDWLHAATDEEIRNHVAEVAAEIDLDE